MKLINWLAAILALVFFGLVGAGDYRAEKVAEERYCLEAAKGETPYYKGGKDTFCRQYTFR